jgi:hypothetical protein
MARLVTIFVAAGSSLAVAAAASEATHSTNLWKPLTLVEAMVAGDIECAAGDVVIDLGDVTMPKPGAKHEAKVVKVNSAEAFGSVIVANQGSLVMLVSADADAKKLMPSDQVEFQKCGKKAAPPSAAAPTNSGR